MIWPPCLYTFYVHLSNTYVSVTCVVSDGVSLFSSSSRKLMTDAANNKQSTSSSGTPGKSKSLETVPVVPYGTDLLDWGQDFEVPLIAR